MPLHFFFLHRQFLYGLCPPLARSALASRLAPNILFSDLLEIETALPEIETILCEIKTILPEIKTILPEIDILS